MEIQPTTRAYTLRLAASQEAAWRDLLWRTHLTVNRGVQAWGEWLLTLRGALPAALADGHPERRGLLALSWLSVESPCAAVSPNFIVARGSESNDERAERVLKRFRLILESKGVQGDDQQPWIAACEPALKARIRSDACWVDRRAAFEELVKKCGGQLTVDWATGTLFDLLDGSDEYFAVPDDNARATTEGNGSVIKAGNWLSTNWGFGEKSDSAAIATALERLAAIPETVVVGNPGSVAIVSLARAAGCNLNDAAASGDAFRSVKQIVGWKGRPSKGAMALQRLMEAERVTADLWATVTTKLREESTSQGGKTVTKAPTWMASFRKEFEEQLGMHFRTTKDHIWEYAVMLDHALRRVSAAHTWIKRAEMSRNDFAADAAKMDQVPADARKWLDDYCDERSTECGAVEEYIIRRRAIDGWDEVLARWEKDRCQSRLGRIETARAVQSEWPEDKKFGDIQLFAGAGDEGENNPHRCLADDDASCLWCDPEILRSYVFASVAANDQQRFKVPAYRHPDPLLHPVYVDFGNSRWGIEYSALTAAQSRLKLHERLATAKTDIARQRVRTQLEQAPSLREVMLDLWNGEAIVEVPVAWCGKRLEKDLDFAHFGLPGAPASRADRLGRSIANEASGSISVAEVFDQKEWNGRLQISRRQLNQLAKYLEKKGLQFDQPEEWDEKAKYLWHNLRWFLSFSAKLLPARPWLDDPANVPSGWQYKKGRNGYYLNIEANKDRKGRARLRLARIKNVRILSVDLGHRFAAACAVWHALAESDFLEEVSKRRTLRGGTGKSDLYFHTQHIDDTGKLRTTVYRRIGPDMWARLDRQFLIKLQGEDRSPRAASAAELKKVNELRDWLGLEPIAARERLTIDGPRQVFPRVDKLLSDALQVARLGLRRHGDYARIAYALTAQEKPISGGRIAEMGREERIEYLLDSLILWQKLAGSTDFRDPWANQLWQVWIAGRGANEPVTISDEMLRTEAKKKLEATRSPLRAVAEQLVDRDNSDLHSLWKNRWEQRTSEWRVQLKQLRRLILPRGKGQNKSIRRVGGLSYSRLGNIDKLYKLLKSFHTQPEPQDLRAGIKRLEAESDQGRKFGDRILISRERMRENRVKQLASRVVEAALGIGSENKRHWVRRRKRPQGRIADSRFAPCHVVVVEDLDNYRPEDKRPRRENRQLMNWAARNVRKFLKEGCLLNGLHFEEVAPEYTSFQDSRTGAPGFRCVDVLTDKLRIEFEELRSGSRRTRFATALEKVKQGRGSARDRFLADLTRALEANPPMELPRTIRLTHKKGGDLFVSAASDSSASKGIQADLNAAANIGLKALMDPDWPGAWWYIPAVLDAERLRVPSPEKCQGCKTLEGWRMGVSEFGYSTNGPPEPVDANWEASKPKRGKRRQSERQGYTNLWRDLTTTVLTSGTWRVHAAYWNDVEKRVIDILRARLWRATDLTMAH